jgi:DNA invertase Pin-like site-specific DNA recombinase
LVNALDEFNRIGVDFVSYKENLDTNSPAGKVLFHIISAFSSFEAEIIRERVIAGMEKAKTKGIKIGRPKIPIFIVKKVLQMQNNGICKSIILRETGISKSKYYQIVNQSIED